MNKSYRHNQGIFGLPRLLGQGLVRLVPALVLTLPLSVGAGEVVDFDLGTPPGRLVSVGSHKLHILCKGHGRGSVVIDSGVGGFSLEWTRVQNALAKHYRVCTYDRAGYGWSKPGPLPRTTEQIATELYTLLKNADVQGPYILVGHSFGGYNVRYFASKYPEEVQGLVLIDSSHPDQDARFPSRESRNSAPAHIVKVPDPYEPYTRRIWISRPVMPDNYPDEVRQIAFALMSTEKAAITQRQELESFQLSAGQVASAGPLPNVPLVVLTRGKRVWPANPNGDLMEQVWMELQDELATLTPHSVHLVAEHSGHAIQLDEPGLVITAVAALAESTSVHYFAQNGGRE
ncbi:MAG: alpha/beta hydrolase [Gammaproteobacteria bacterium]|nr:alpha/beta hydrolase [Gammaproteobacteria bacterium]MCI0591311.1 alpha/beta hydrolase [Gammaproteobacteria bacterium]